MRKEVLEVNNSALLASGFASSIKSLNLTLFEHRDKKSKTFRQHCMINQMDHQQSGARRKHNFRGHEVSSHPAKDSKSELFHMTEKAISKLLYSEGLGKWEEDHVVEVTTIYEILGKKNGENCAVLKDMILDQLLAGISSSTEDIVIRASISILTSIAAANKSVIEDVKKKGLQLSDLASALKRNVQEAAVLFYLMNPTPAEIKTFELLPTLAGIMCTSNSYKCRSGSLPSPMTACLMITEILVTAFDHATNNMHLAEISSPNVLEGLLDVARDTNIEELISLATILVKCIQYDGDSRRYISKLAPVAPFVRLLESNNKHAKFIALEFFHHALCMPRYENILQIPIDFMTTIQVI